MQKALFMNATTKKQKAPKRKYMTGIDNLDLLRRLTGTAELSLTHSELRIAAFLAAEAKANKEGFCGCSKKDLAAGVGVSEKTVDRSLSRLRREGVIESVPQYAENGTQLANAYRLIS